MRTGLGARGRNLHSVRLLRLGRVYGLWLPTGTRSRQFGWRDLHGVRLFLVGRMHRLWLPRRALSGKWPGRRDLHRLWLLNLRDLHGLRMPELRLASSAFGSSPEKPAHSRTGVPGPPTLLAASP
jgi:hypothetical protein